MAEASAIDIDPAEPEVLNCVRNAEVQSLLDVLKAPRDGDLSRERKIAVNQGGNRRGSRNKPTYYEPTKVSAKQRVEEFKGEDLIVRNNEVYCAACKEVVSVKMSIMKVHVKELNKEKLKKLGKREEDIVQALHKYDQAHHPKGQTLSTSTRVFRIKVVQAFLKSGTSLNRVEFFREIFEEAGMSLSSSSNMRQLIPFILEEEYKSTTSMKGRRVWKNLTGRVMPRYNSTRWWSLWECAKVMFPMNVADQRRWYQYAVRECLVPAFDYYSQTLVNDVVVAKSVRVFKAARLFNPKYVKVYRPNAADINQLDEVPFLNNNEIQPLRTELPMYLVKAADIPDDFDPQADIWPWWKADLYNQLLNQNITSGGGLPAQAFGSGLVSGNDINDTSEDYLKFPDYSNPDHFTGAWQMLRDEIKISPKMLRDRGVHSFPYTWSVFSDLYDLSAMSEREVEVDLMNVSGSNSSSTQASQAPLPTLSQANVAASPTMTVNVPSSMLSPSATAAQQPASSSTNQEWMKNSKYSAYKLALVRASLVNQFAHQDAIIDTLTFSSPAMEAHAECIKKGDKPENVSSFSLVPMVQHYGLELAKFYVANGMGVNETGFIFKKLFAFGSGLVSGNDINDTSEDYLKFPDYSNPDHFTGAWQMLRDEIKISPKMLRDRGVHSFPYTWSVFSDLYDLSAMSEREVEVDLMKRIADSYISDLYVDDYGRLRTNKKFPDITLNSQVFTFSPLSPMGKLDKPLLVTLRHRKVQGFANPRCVSWNPTRRMYHTKGCSVHETNETHTVCACEHFGSYAVAMDKTIPDDATERETVVTVAWVLSTISLLCLIICAACIIVVGYHFVDNMRIALCLDVSLALGYLIFYFGLSSGNTNFYASRSSCDVISPLMHLFQLAALTWLLMEGLHYVSVFKKVFNKENSQPCCLALAREAQWCNIFLISYNKKKDIKVKKVTQHWRFRLLSFIVLLLVVILTWVFGVLAANSSEKKGFHYAFIVLFVLQGILVAVFYAAQNKELWDYYRQKKEKKLKEKTAVFHFEYIP
ncbi:predicted protein [Nematostella vectensis]|uniref:GAIN-B domain-containing protein n=1 Tax=Nematostella vectensis TaxID=45351 RepID=A7REQ7_NEMVE|nr:predicted protein [Nematostella vectensis]|eukprot:XP_001642019.1 predicted protein [Nematostella vectensis]